MYFSAFIINCVKAKLPLKLYSTLIYMTVWKHQLDNPIYLSGFTNSAVTCCWKLAILLLLNTAFNIWSFGIYNF